MAHTTKHADEEKKKKAQEDLGNAATKKLLDRVDNPDVFAPGASPIEKAVTSSIEGLLTPGAAEEFTSSARPPGVFDPGIQKSVFTSGVGSKTFGPDTQQRTFDPGIQQKIFDPAPSTDIGVAPTISDVKEAADFGGITDRELPKTATVGDFSKIKKGVTNQDERLLGRLQQNVRDAAAARGLNVSRGGARLENESTSEFLDRISQREFARTTALENLRFAQESTVFGQEARLANIQLAKDQISFEQSKDEFLADFNTSIEAFNQSLSSGTFDLQQAGQQFGQGVTTFSLNTAESQRAFDQAATTFGLNAAQSQQLFSQAATIFDLNSAEGQKEFVRLATTFGLNADQSQQFFNNLVTTQGVNFQQADLLFDQDIKTFAVNAGEEGKLIDTQIKAVQLGLGKIGIDFNEDLNTFTVNLASITGSLDQALSLISLVKNGEIKKAELALAKKGLDAEKAARTTALIGSLIGGVASAGTSFLLKK